MTAGPAGTEKRAQRIARLKGELDDEGIALPEAVRDLVVEEVVYARHIEVHEGIRPAFGALIASIEGLESVIADIRTSDQDVDSIRPFADGSSAVVVREIGAPETARLLAIELPDELARLDLAQTTSGVVVHRTDGGTITITQADSIIVNEVFAWRTRPAARDRLLHLQEIFGLEGQVSLELFARLLDLAFHQLSPLGIGATLVVDIRGSAEFTEGSLAQEGDAAPLPINLLNVDESRMLATFLRIVDGACLIAGDGRIVRTQAKLATKVETSKLIGADRGTRHSSAKWFSFDHPEVVVFVVSADGPVSLYSDGMKVAVFDDVRGVEELPHAMNTAPEQAADLAVHTETIECGGCERPIVITAYRYPGSDKPLSVSCPICSRAIATIEASALTTRPKKPWQ